MLYISVVRNIHTFGLNFLNVFLVFFAIEINSPVL